MIRDPLDGLTSPDRLYSREEVTARGSTVIPRVAGIYGWFFRELPDARIDPSNCVFVDGMPLLYVGIAPKAPPAVGSPSKESLRSRIRNHYTGNAEGSTLRLTLGCLLSERLGIRLSRVGSGKRLTFTDAGEPVLSAWMGENAFVAWVETTEAWRFEDEALERLDLPLNLRGNQHHPFHPVLTAVRAAAKAHARISPIVQ